MKEKVYEEIQKNVHEILKMDGLGFRPSTTKLYDKAVEEKELQEGDTYTREDFDNAVIYHNTLKYNRLSLYIKALENDSLELRNYLIKKEVVGANTQNKVVTLLTLLNKQDMLSLKSFMRSLKYSSSFDSIETKRSYEILKDKSLDEQKEYILNEIESL